MDKRDIKTCYIPCAYVYNRIDIIVFINTQNISFNIQLVFIMYISSFTSKRLLRMNILGGWLYFCLYMDGLPCHTTYYIHRMEWNGPSWWKRKYLTHTRSDSHAFNVYRSSTYVIYFVLTTHTIDRKRQRHQSAFSDSCYTIRKSDPMLIKNPLHNHFVYLKLMKKTKRNGTVERFNLGVWIDLATRCDLGI